MLAARMRSLPRSSGFMPERKAGPLIAADTVGWLDGRVVGKPTDRADAGRILRSLAGRIHELWTGVVVWRTADDRQLCWQEVSRVAVQDFSQTELEAYLDTDRWVGASGAYSIREDGDAYLTVVEGSVSNVIGLPMESLAVELVRFGGL